MSRAVALALVLVASLVAGPLASETLAGRAAGTSGAPSATVASGAIGTADATGQVDAANATNRSAATPTIEKTVRLHLTPSEAGRIDISVTYDVPEELTSLTVRLPEESADVTSEAFSESSDGYEWDAETDPASLRFSVPANRSSPRGDTTGAQGTYAFVDAGSWALVTVPQFGSEWRWRGAGNVTLTERVRVAGEGSTGGEVAYLGPVETHTRTANGQTFTLAVPAGASMAESPADVLDSLTAASDRLRVGERDENVWVGVAPDDVQWAAQGIEYGGSDFWVVASARLDDPGNVWLHEYIHTRQDYTSTSSGQWTVEALADYYGALLTLEQERIDFDVFSQYLGRGDDAPWRDAVLARPETWEYGANYVKGSLVWGELDRRVRLATNSSHAMMDVFWRLNHQDGEVSNEDVLAAVAGVASSRVAGVGERYTATRSAPEMWSQFEHRGAFSTEPARMAYDGVEYRVTGPFRNESFDAPPTLYVGETLVVDATVTNTGGTDGRYEATLALDGDVLAATDGSLRPSESATVTLQREFDDAGSYNVSLGRGSTAADVRTPSEPSVSDVAVSQAEDSNVTVTATLSSPSDAPAAGTVDVTVDGERVASMEAALSAGKSVTRRVTVDAGDDGAQSVVVGNQTAGTESADGRDSDTAVPGFGVASAGVALLCAAAFAAWRTRTRR